MEHTEYWIRPGQGKKAIAFIHGIGANDPRVYWQHFLAVITKDKGLDEFDVFVWKYPTHVQPSAIRNALSTTKKQTLRETAPRIAHLGAAWGTTYHAQFQEYQDIFLVCHSMGGLVIKSWIIETLAQGQSTNLTTLRHIAFYATPHQGAPVTILARWNKQLKDMQLDSSFIEEVNRGWSNHVVAWKEHSPGLTEERFNRFIPHLVLAGLNDAVVPSKSATISDMPLATISGDHSQIIQPSNSNDTRYKIWRIQMDEICTKTVPQTVVASSPEQPNTFSLPSKSVWNVPFARNPFFSERTQELAYLHTQLQQSNTIAVGQTQAVSGLGGIGKTQLAVEYAYQHRDEYQYVFWARAESVEALTSSFTEIARQLGLSKQDTKEQEITLQAVKCWLEQKHGWLLILDNADSPDLLPAFLPSPIDGHVLITTRAADLSTHLAGVAHSLTVETFSDEQGALFLLHRSGLLKHDAPFDQAEGPTRQLALEIAHELGGLPLALDQAGAYLSVTGSNLATYLHIYKQHRAELLKQRRSADHSEPVATTWDISFHNVEQQNPAAADLLRLCAFLAPNAIPEAIITKGTEELGPLLASVAADPFLLNAAIECLRAYSLIARDPQTQTLSVHRLVQVVVRDSLSTEIQRQWMQYAVHTVALAYPDLDFASWSIIERFLPHALTCAIWIEQAPLVTPAATFLLNQTGRYLDDRAWYKEAEPLLKKALAIREQELGATHPDTAQSLNNLALLYTKQGEYTRAEPLYRRALAICEQELGTEHIYTAVSLSNLGLLYKMQGKYTEVEPLYQRALAICEQELGTEHPDTARNLNNLASLYESQGKYAKVELLYQQALEIRQQQLGLQHPDTAQSLNNLALCIGRQGRYAEAEPLLQQALEIRQQQLGLQHPDTAQSLDNLAGLYERQGKYTKVELLSQQALAIRQQQLGTEHLDTALSLNNLASFYVRQGKYTEAEPLYQHALATSERELGQEHPHTATTLGNLADLYGKQGKYAEAEILYQRALAIFEQQLGSMHPTTATCLSNLALFYLIQRRYEEAEPLLECALKIREQQLGAEHPDVAISLNNLACFYQSQREYKKAEPLYQRALAIEEQQLGITHLSTRNTRFNYLSLLNMLEMQCRREFIITFYAK